MLGKSHRYISWIAEVFKGCLGWSNCGVLIPGRAKFSKYAAEVGEDPSLTEWFCFKNDLFILQRHRPFVCWCSAAPLRDKTRLCRVCSGKTGAGIQPDTSKLLDTAPVYPCCFLPFVVVPKLGHSSLYTPPVSYSPASTSVSPADLFHWLERESDAGVSVKFIQSRCKSSGKSLRIRHVWKWTLLGW